MKKEPSDKSNKAVYWALGILVLIIGIIVILYYQNNSGIIQFENEGGRCVPDYKKSCYQDATDDELTEALFPNGVTGGSLTRPELEAELKKQCEFTNWNERYDPDFKKTGYIRRDEASCTGEDAPYFSKYDTYSTTICRLCNFIRTSEVVIPPPVKPEPLMGNELMKKFRKEEPPKSSLGGIQGFQFHPGSGN